MRWGGASKGSGSFRKLHPDPTVRLETFITHWCAAAGLEATVADVVAWAEAEHPVSFKRAVGYLGDHFAPPLQELLMKYRSHIDEQASKTQQA